MFLFGFCISLFIETLLFEKILVIFDNTPDLSKTSNLRYAEKDLFDIFSKFRLLLSLLEIEKGNFMLPLKIDDISETKADVVAAGPAPSP